MREALLALSLAMASVATAIAQGYPQKPIRFIVPFPPGGGADTLARLIGQHVSARLGQQIVIDNRSGAGGIVAAELGTKAAPDGYTLTQANVSHAIAMSFYRHPSYDLTRDFTPVTELASIPFLLVVSAMLPAQSLEQLIALAKAKPGQFNYASSGNGSASHLSMELLKSMASIDLRHVPYRGAGPAASDVIAGNVPIMFATLAAALPQTAAGKLRGLAVGGAKRSPAAPQFPTVAESGLAGFRAETWYGVLAPSATPRAIVARLNAAFVAALSAGDTHERLMNLGFEPVGSSSDEFLTYIQAEIPKWARVVKSSGAAVD